MSGSILAVAGRGVPQVGPVDIRPEFFAAHCAGSGFFDGNAMFDRHALGAPLGYGAGGNAQQLGQVALAAEGIACFFDWVHAAQFSADKCRSQ